MSSCSCSCRRRSRPTPPEFLASGAYHARRASWRLAALQHERASPAQPAIDDAIRSDGNEPDRLYRLSWRGGRRRNRPRTAVTSTSGLAGLGTSTALLQAPSSLLYPLWSTYGIVRCLSRLRNCELSPSLSV